MTRDREARTPLLAVERGKFAENRRQLVAAAEPGMRKVRKSFGALLELIRAGTSVRRACLELGLHREHVKRAIRDPDRRARYDDAMAASIPLRKARLPEHMAKVWAGRRQQCADLRLSLAHLDAILRLVEQGESLAAACRSNPDYPTPALVRAALNQDPALMQRYLTSSKHRRIRPPKPVTPALVAAIIADVAGGVLLRDACAKRKIEIPAFQFRALNDPSLRSRWFGAKEARTAVRLARGTLLHAGEIIGLIETGAPLRQVLASNPEYPHPATFRHALDSDGDLRWRYDQAITANRDGRLRHRRRRLLQIAAPASRSTSLSSDTLWRLAADALPRNLDPDIRNDVAADIVAALLAGELDVGDVKQQAKRFITAHYKLFGTQQTISLDAPLRTDSEFSLADLQTTWGQ